MGSSSRRRRRVAGVIAGMVAGSGGVFAVFAAAASPSAFAASSPYELYCPGTPVGNIVLNNVVTSGTITPASPSSGQQFNLTGYQSQVALPTSIVTAAAALGNSAIAGTAVTKVDATGATPSGISSGNLPINAPIPSPVPAAGLSLTLPATASTIGPFTATGGSISLTVDPAVSLSLNVSGSTLTLTCHPYPNNTAATGIVASAPAGATAAPVIATASAGTATATTAPPTTAPTATATSAPATSPASSTLASTGPGPHLWIVAIAGFIVLYLGSVALAVVERPRSLLRRILRLQRPATAAPAPAMAAPSVQSAVAAAPLHPPAAQASRVTGRSAPRPPVAGGTSSSYPRAGDSGGLWFDGCEPEDRTRS